MAGDLRTKAGDAVAKVGDVASEAVEEAKRSANTLAAEAGEKVKAMLNQQVGVGADMAGHVAASARAAADSLDPTVPQFAELIRVAGDRVERLAQEIRSQPIDELMRRTTDFARERPAVTFGAAALCGFALFRLFKAGSDGAPGSSSGRRPEDWRSHENTGQRYHRQSPSISPQDTRSHGA
jgi:ElaB/YqjD/DUF883 family membrane-anchored ribosome-binding protein